VPIKLFRVFNITTIKIGFFGTFKFFFKNFNFFNIFLVDHSLISEKHDISGDVKLREI
jgi:hypothetical protein